MDHLLHKRFTEDEINHTLQSMALDKLNEERQLRFDRELFYAIDKGSSDEVRFLMNSPYLDKSRHQEYIEGAYDEEFTDIMEIFFNAGFDVITTVRGKSILLQCIFDGKVKVLKCLSCYGINLNEILYKENLRYSELEGCTALHYAAMKLNIDIIKILVEFGADKTLKTRNGDTPCDLYCKAIKRYMVENPVDSYSRHEEFDTGIKLLWCDEPQ